MSCSVPGARKLVKMSLLSSSNRDTDLSSRNYNHRIKKIYKKNKYQA